MDGKKNPGKFTIRFNIGDPRQREAIEILDRQSRYKAQFLTDAILHYTHCVLEPEARSAGALNREEIRRIVCEVLSEQQNLPRQASIEEPIKPSCSDFGEKLSETEKDAIFKTMRDFQRS